MDHTRSIYLALAAILLLSGAAVVASLFIPFDVAQDNTVQVRGEGGALLRQGKQQPVTMEPEQDITLEAGDSFVLEANDAATVRFFNEGWAVIEGPAEFVLRESHRHATATGHLTGNNADYVLKIAQKAGTARYNFERADPAYDDMAITIELPNGNYVPQAPCWEVTITVDGTARTENIPCDF